MDVPVTLRLIPSTWKRIMSDKRLFDILVISDTEILVSLF